jgi:hypothetical protein
MGPPVCAPRRSTLQHGRLEVEPCVVRLEARHAQQEREVARLAATEDVDVEAFCAGIGMREHETRARFTGRDIAWHREVVEALVHYLARLLRVTTAVHVRDFERREVFRVGTDWRVAGEHVGTVLDLQPDRLDALVVEVDTE